MKKFTLSLFTVLLMLAIIPVQAKAGMGIHPVTTDSTKSAESIEANALILRLNEIKSMDRSKLSSTEKKELKKEVKSLKTRLKEVGGGVYLSAGAIIIIILLLILLL
jgi:hypothetical protein